MMYCFPFCLNFAFNFNLRRSIKAWRKRARVRAWRREGVDVFRRRRQELMAAAACGAWLHATRRRRRARRVLAARRYHRAAMVLRAWAAAAAIAAATAHSKHTAELTPSTTACNSKPVKENVTVPVKAAKRVTETKHLVKDSHKVERCRLTLSIPR
jgi:hypothetical protein